MCETWLNTVQPSHLFNNAYVEESSCGVLNPFNIHHLSLDLIFNELTDYEDLTFSLKSQKIREGSET